MEKSEGAERSQIPKRPCMIPIMNWATVKATVPMVLPLYVGKTGALLVCTSKSLPAPGCSHWKFSSKLTGTSSPHDCLSGQIFCAIW